MKLYKKIEKFSLKVLLYLLGKKYSDDKSYLIALGKFTLGYKMDLENPRTFNEKINWYKLNYRNKLMPMCADKVMVDKYVSSKGLSSILIKKYAVYDSPSQIDLNSLPNKFVMKNNHSSGDVIICNGNKNRLNIGKIVDAFDSKFGDFYREWPYNNIERKILVEKLIETDDGSSPQEYNFFCFNGEPKFFFFVSDRNKKCTFDFFDLDFNHIDVKQHHPNSRKSIKKPAQFEKMISISKILSKDFPFVRVDLFCENNVIYFGELTFFHFAGLVKFSPQKYDKIFGDFFDISSISKDYKR